MIPKINVKFLENDFYNVKGTNIQNVNIAYIDFLYQQAQTQTLQPSTHFNTITPQVYTKNISLTKTLQIPIDYYTKDKDIFYFIKNELNKEFFKKITILGEQHRLKTINFDIDIQKIKQNSIHVGSSILNRLVSISNYIYTESRIGPAQYFISNKKTYNYILSYISDINLTYKDNKLMIGNTPFIINDSIDDDIILVGRKNSLEQSGVHYLIYTDKNNNIELHEIMGFMNRNLILHYEIFDIGIGPELQYLKINTQSIAYYRNKKLQKIKAIYNL